MSAERIPGRSYASIGERNPGTEIVTLIYALPLR